MKVMRGLAKLGRDLRLARLKRRLRMTTVAERAGISRETLAKIQKGDPGVSMGNYAAVILAIGFGTGWMDLADVRNDRLGQGIDEENVPKRARDIKA